MQIKKNKPGESNQRNKARPAGARSRKRTPPRTTPGAAFAAPSRDNPDRGAAPQEAAGGEDPAESLRRGGGGNAAEVPPGRGFGPGCSSGWGPLSAARSRCPLSAVEPGPRCSSAPPIRTPPPLLPPPSSGAQLLPPRPFCC